MVFCNKKEENGLTKVKCHNPYFSRWFSAISLQDFNCKDNEVSQSLFQQMVFCNKNCLTLQDFNCSHNPYFSRWFSAITRPERKELYSIVTILILVDGFLQFEVFNKRVKACEQSQSLFQQMVFCNWYINKLQLIKRIVTILILVDGFLQYDRRIQCTKQLHSHNPYFSRWFSAIPPPPTYGFSHPPVTILILVDGFLQSEYGIYEPINVESGHNPYFSRWFSAIKRMIRRYNHFKKRHNPYFSRWFSAIQSKK